MKSYHYSLIIIGVLVECNKVLTKPQSKKVNDLDNHYVEVSDRQLNELITGALKGFRSVIRNGDKILNIDSMEPYEIEDDLMWFYDDRIGQTKIYATTQGSSFLHGLSTYTVEEVSGSMRSLNVEIKLKFNLLQGFGNFKLGGHLFGGIVPLSGSGSIIARAPRVDMTICANMSLFDSKITIDKTSLNINLDNFSVKATNVMDIPALHANEKVNEILHKFYERYKMSINNILNEIVENAAVKSVNGMTITNLINILQYLANKKSSGSSLTNAILAQFS